MLPYPSVEKQPGLFLCVEGRRKISRPVENSPEKGRFADMGVVYC